MCSENVEQVIIMQLFVNNILLTTLEKTLKNFGKYFQNGWIVSISMLKKIDIYFFQKSF
jgi:hypothetical protein